MHCSIKTFDVRKSKGKLAPQVALPGKETVNHMSSEPVFMLKDENENIQLVTVKAGPIPMSWIETGLNTKK